MSAFDDAFTTTLRSQLKQARSQLLQARFEYNHVLGRYNKMEKTYNQFFGDMAECRHDFTKSRQEYVHARKLNGQSIDTLKYSQDRNWETTRQIQQARRAIRRAKRHHRSAYVNVSTARTNRRSVESDLKATRQELVESMTRLKVAEHRYDRLQNTLTDRVARLEEDRSRNREIACKAGVPQQFIDDVVVSVDEELNQYNIYFGGQDQPDGPNHGHYVVDFEFWPLYRREPGESRGGQNFINSHVDVKRRSIAAQLRLAQGEST